mgnify:CR=1 FL=1
MVIQNRACLNCKYAKLADESGVSICTRYSPRINAVSAVCEAWELDDLTPRQYAFDLHPALSDTGSAAFRAQVVPEQKESIKKRVIARLRPGKRG